MVSAAPTTRDSAFSTRQGKSVRDFYNAYWAGPPAARELVARFWWQPVYSRLAAELPAAGKILVLGCGTGHDCALIANPRRMIVGLDLSDAAVRATRRAGHPVAQAALEELPFRRGAFDAVWIANVLMFTDRARAMREAKRLTRPGGKVLLLEPRSRAFVISWLRRFRIFADQVDAYWNDGDCAEFSVGAAEAHEEHIFLFSPLLAGVLYHTGLNAFSKRLMTLFCTSDRFLLRTLPFLRRWSYLSFVRFRMPE